MTDSKPNLQLVQSAPAEANLSLMRTTFEVRQPAEFWFFQERSNGSEKVFFGIAPGTHDVKSAARVLQVVVGSLTSKNTFEDVEIAGVKTGFNFIGCEMFVKNAVVNNSIKRRGKGGADLGGTLTLPLAGSLIYTDAHYEDAHVKLIMPASISTMVFTGLTALNTLFTVGGVSGVEEARDALKSFIMNSLSKNHKLQVLKGCLASFGGRVVRQEVYDLVKGAFCAYTNKAMPLEGQLLEAQQAFKANLAVTVVLSDTVAEAFVRGKNSTRLLGETTHAKEFDTEMAKAAQAMYDEFKKATAAASKK